MNYEDIFGVSLIQSRCTVWTVDDFVGIFISVLLAQKVHGWLCAWLTLNFGAILCMAGAFMHINNQW